MNVQIKKGIVVTNSYTTIGFSIDSSLVCDCGIFCPCSAHLLLLPGMGIVHISIVYPILSL